MKQSILIHIIEQKVYKILSEIRNGQQKRYIVTAQFHVYADTDKNAIKEADKLIVEMNKKYDNDATLDHVYVDEYGSMYNKKIK